jgi:hypothetical protein
MKLLLFYRYMKLLRGLILTRFVHISSAAETETNKTKMGELR